MARVLDPVAAVFGAIAASRLTRTTPYCSATPVICVGNFTAGGTGKTPFTALLANRLIGRGARPAILTRGYGAKRSGPHWVDPARDTAEDVGDEALLLVRHAPVLVSPDRAIGAKAIEAKGCFNVIVMDDGLQNPQLAKTLSFAIVDGARGLGNGCVIPAGPLRMPMAIQARLADRLVFNGQPSIALANDMAAYSTHAPLVATLTATGPSVAGQRCIAFAGIGHPERFFATLRSLGATLVETHAFPDHAPFSSATASALLASARRHDAQLITTEKDFVRLAGLPELAARTRSLPVQFVLSGDASGALDAMLDQVVPR
jgi:tetraacyldisaccharide 4'-kinase